MVYSVRAGEREKRPTAHDYAQTSRIVHRRRCVEEAEFGSSALFRSGTVHLGNIGSLACGSRSAMLQLYLF